MSNIIQNIIGLFSRTNIKAELVSLQTQYLELKNKHDLTQALIAELVKEVKECSGTLQTINDTIETQCQDYLDANFDDTADSWFNNNVDIESSVESWADNYLEDRVNSIIGDYDFTDVIDAYDFTETLKDYQVLNEENIAPIVSNSDWIKNVVREEIENELEREDKSNDQIIDDAIKLSIENKIVSKMEAKFGEGWDNWFDEHTRFCVKNVLAEFLQSAYEQTRKENK